jgi:hypothetical protein
VSSRSGSRSRGRSVSRIRSKPPELRPSLRTAPPGRVSGRPEAVTAAETATAVTMLQRVPPAARRLMQGGAVASVAVPRLALRLRLGPTIDLTVQSSIDAVLSAEAAFTSRRASSASPRAAGARWSAARRYSITWSARANTDCGMLSPSALAVFRLMTNSNVVGCSIGRSRGLAPLRILSTYEAARRYISAKFGP